MWVWKSQRISCVQKGYVWNPATFTCETEKYLGSIVDESVFMYDKIIETTKGTLTKTVPPKIITTKAAPASFYILLAFLLFL